ncbi:MAG: flavin reductase family protein [Armatimonadota bacterium]
MPDKLKLKPSIVHFHSWPLVLVTCADAAGRPNIIALAAAAACSYNPPTLGIAVAPPRFSHHLIAESGEFGLSIPRRDQLEAADLTGSISGREFDKFAEAGFTPMRSTKIAAPLIAECPVNFECKVVHTAKLGSHDWFIGEIVAVHAEAGVVDGGQVDQDRVDGVVCRWGEYLSWGPKLADWNYSLKKRRERR